jgi:methenyltetrahydromethanopterin cyclohydrolase
VTGSVVGAARTAELAAYRLMELGYDPVDILSVTGSAPVAPVADSEERAMATTNDAVGYGGQAHLVVEEPFDDFADVVSVADDEYGAPFIEIFDSVDWAFDELPMELFAPAQVTVNVVGGETEVYGDVSENILADSFGL